MNRRRGNRQRRSAYYLRSLAEPSQQIVELPVFAPARNRRERAPKRRGYAGMCRRKLDPDDPPIHRSNFRRRLVVKVGVHLLAERPALQQVSPSEPFGH